MGKRPQTQQPNERYEALKAASGWYLQAWRHYRNLTLEELAAEAGTSRGVVSDLETGAPKKDGRAPTRFNRDWVDTMSRALNVTGGYLIDVNPFATKAEFMVLKEQYDQLDERAQADAMRLIEALARR